jgi:tRNA (guanine37-N1)-methyltransferase
MRFDVVTLFPEMFEGFASLGVVGRALRDEALELRFHSPRAFGLGKHHSVDDTPYGGGAGMVMRVDCVVQSMEALDETAPDGVVARRVLLSPQGARLDQRKVHALAKEPALMLVCGRYEGIDHRVRDYIAEEVSLGDFVLSGGELAAMALIDAVSRCVPGVLGNPESLVEESHSPASGGQIEYPHYTRPVSFRGANVPDVLVSGNHAKISQWRQERSLERTKQLRGDSPSKDATP